MSVAPETTPGHELVELRMSARPENLALARLALTGVAAGVDAPDEVVADLKLAVTEICTNAIQHAYPMASADNEIVVRYTAGTGTLLVEVRDEGVGFEPSDRPLHPLLNGEERGMGLLIVEALADELRISSGGDGTRVVFVRRFGPAAA